MMSKHELRTALFTMKVQLRKKVRDPGGTECPLCDQHAQVYRRRINSGAARGLILMWRLAGTEGQWVHAPSTEHLSRLGGELARLAYWGLIEEEAERRPDGGRAGYWRVTWKGECFVRGKIKVPKYAEVYNGRVIGMDSTEMVTIRDALGTKFDYSELMAGA